MESEYKLVLHYWQGQVTEDIKIRTNNPIAVSKVAKSLLSTYNNITSIDIYDTTCNRLIATKKR